MTDPDPTSRPEPTPAGDDLREYLDLVDEVVEAITDADVDAGLAAVLARAGYDPGTAGPDPRPADFEPAEPEPGSAARPGGPRDRVARRDRQKGQRGLTSRTTGTVKWFDADKGFITVGDGDDGVSPEESQRVELDITQGQKGPQAEDIGSRRTE